MVEALCYQHILSDPLPSEYLGVWTLMTLWCLDFNDATSLRETSYIKQSTFHLIGLASDNSIKNSFQRNPKLCNLR